MRVPSEELYLQNLEEQWPTGSFWHMPKEKAREELQKLTGADHGLDAAAWRKWIKEWKKQRKKQK